MGTESSQSVLAAVDDIRRVLTEWVAAKNFRNVDFVETLEPDNSDIDDIQTDYEAIVEPTSLELARFEIWVLPGGYIQIGLEQYDRLKKRLGLHTWLHGYVDVQYGCHLTEQQLVAILEEIAAGSVFVTAKSNFGFLGRVRAAITEEVKNRLALKGYENLEWMNGMEILPNDTNSNVRFSLFGKSHIVRYKGW